MLEVENGHQSSQSTQDSSPATSQHASSASAASTSSSVSLDRTELDDLLDELLGHAAQAAAAATTRSAGHSRRGGTPPQSRIGHACLQVDTVKAAFQPRHRHPIEDRSEDVGVDVSVMECGLNPTRMIYLSVANSFHAIDSNRFVFRSDKNRCFDSVAALRFAELIK